MSRFSTQWIRVSSRSKIIVFLSELDLLYLSSLSDRPSWRTYEEQTATYNAVGYSEIKLKYGRALRPKNLRCAGCWGLLKYSRCCSCKCKGLSRMACLRIQSQLSPGRLIFPIWMTASSRCWISPSVISTIVRDLCAWWWGISFSRVFALAVCVLIALLPLAYPSDLGKPSFWGWRLSLTRVSTRNHGIDPSASHRGAILKLSCRWVWTKISFLDWLISILWSCPWLSSCDRELSPQFMVVCWSLLDEWGLDWGSFLN